MSQDGRQFREIDCICFQNVLTDGKELLTNRERSVVNCLGVKKFQQYLEGRHFTLLTDHQPLKYIMNPGKAVPMTAAARMQQWCVFLSAFSYAIDYQRTDKHANCDGLFRLPQSPVDHIDEVDMFVSSITDSLPVT